MTQTNTSLEQKSLTLRKNKKNPLFRIFILALQCNIAYGMITLPFKSFETSDDKVFAYIFVYGLGGIISFLIVRWLLNTKIFIEIQTNVLNIKTGTNNNYKIPLSDLMDVKINNISVKQNERITNAYLSDYDKFIRGFISDLTFKQTGLNLTFVLKNQKSFTVKRICPDDYTKVQDFVQQLFSNIKFEDRFRSH